jgi:hypothetical protein
MTEDPTESAPLDPDDEEACRRAVERVATTYNGLDREALEEQKAADFEELTTAYRSAVESLRGLTEIVAEEHTRTVMYAPFTWEPEDLLAAMEGALVRLVPVFEASGYDMGIVARAINAAGASWVMACVLRRATEDYEGARTLP